MTSTSVKSARKSAASLVPPGPASLIDAMTTEPCRYIFGTRPLWRRGEAPNTQIEWLTNACRPHRHVDSNTAVYNLWPFLRTGIMDVLQELHPPDVLGYRVSLDPLAVRATDLEAEGATLPPRNGPLPEVHRYQIRLVARIRIYVNPTIDEMVLELMDAQTKERLAMWRWDEEGPRRYPGEALEPRTVAARRLYSNIVLAILQRMCGKKRRTLVPMTINPRDFEFEGVPALHLHARHEKYVHWCLYKDPQGQFAHLNRTTSGL